MSEKIKKFIPIVILLAIITALLTYRKLAQEQLFLENWLTLYALALLVIFPIAAVLIPTLNKLIEKLLGNKHLVIQGFAYVIPMISIIGTLMTGLSVVVLRNYQNSNQFFQLYSSELINNLPIFMVMVLVVGGIVKPIVTKRKLAVKN
ncbi:Protein of unknown function [Lutibacter oricola]|uniref:Uncharacterized protein n=1 Tax=Lutibacter oricola TaxID=762486 RepID=A0A1H2QRH8_9FLAO|nr:DUF2798 domain-containing protein [Lutibacter oricola]SDW09813.1 Protein of unknown function [Lutibacter oricola]